MPAHLVDFQSTRWPLITGSRDQLLKASRRLAIVERALPSPAVARAWTARPEWLLLIRTLPPPRFDEMIERLRTLSVAAPRILDDAIEGRFARANAGDARTYLRGYFMTLRQTAAAALTCRSTGARRCAAAMVVETGDRVSRALLDAVGHRRLVVRARAPAARAFTLPPYVVAAYTVGFAAPSWELVSFAGNLYSGTTLSWYATIASHWMSMPATASLVDLARSDRLFSFENAILAMGPLLLRGMIAAVAVRGAKTAFSRTPNVSGDLAWKSDRSEDGGAGGAILAPIGLL